MKSKKYNIFLFFLYLFYIKSLNVQNIILTQDDENTEISSITKDFSLTRDELENEENSEEIFSPYKFSSYIFGEGNYTFDTASFYSWKNNRSISDKGTYTDYINKKNENINGTMKINELNLNYIVLNSASYKDNYGAICIPKSIPERIKESFGKNYSINQSDYIKYSYLDLINSELSDDEKYINYIQDSINEGKITFGKKNEIFDSEKNNKIIKTCSCVSPPDTEEENEFLNFWNCKIDSFYVNNIKMPSSYSISLNGEIYAIFAIDEEYIIAPNITGTEIINYYKSLIDDNYGVTCELNNFTNNTKIMLCKKFNFAELPDFNIILNGEIYLIALSFDLFKEKNDSHVYFKILLNGDNKKEYWYLGDPIIKHYNLLFDYTQPGKETITIVQSDKYESMIIILFFCVSSFITLLFYIVLIIIRVRKIKQDAIDFQDKSQKKEKIKIQRMIKNQNDFEIPEENVTYDNMSKNNFFTDEKKVNNNLEDIEEEKIVERYNINNDLSDSLSDNYKTKKKKRKKNIEKESEIKYQTKERIKKDKDKDIEIEMVNMTEKGISSDEEDDLNIDDEGGIQPLNHRKLKDQ